jgi:hypothetical protein
MHVPINVKSPNNISKWQMGFNSAFKGLKHLKDMCADKIIHSCLIAICVSGGALYLYVFVCCRVLFYPDKKLTKFYSTFGMRALLKN